MVLELIILAILFIGMAGASFAVAAELIAIMGADGEPDKAE
jgi:hypothetical protein